MKCKKHATIEKLVELEQNNWNDFKYSKTWEEEWIIGCYKRYINNKENPEIVKWWQGCIKNYNKNRK